MLVAILFGSLALAFLVWSLELGGPALLLLWPALACGLVSAAYVLNRPGMLGKRADGTMPAWATALYLPPLLGLWGRWHAIRALGREEPWTLVAPGLWLGRRPVAGELPDAVGLVVDLTSEWHRAPGVRALPHRWLSCLDGMRYPDPAALRTLVDSLSADPRPTYVHCAAGHGRSAMVVAALLVRRGLAASPEAALVRLKELRPRVHLTRGQRQQLEAVLSSDPPPAP